MARATADLAARTPAQRLRDALKHLVAGSNSDVPTASALCELASVSRNALYRYHPDVLHELHKLQRRRCREPRPAKRDLQQVRDENEILRQHVAKLAALVDHYFAAWQETISLLRGRERELADLRRDAKPTIVSIGSQRSIT
jgi:hypothetical protein